MCLGGSSEPFSLAAARRGLEGGVDGVRFRRGGEIDAGLREGQFALRRAEIVVGVLGGIGDDQRLRIGKPDVLHRHAHQPAAEIERVLAGVEHAREIVERRVRIGAAHRLVQRRDQIVVAVLALVVDRRAALHDRAAAPSASNISPGRAARQTSSASVSAARPSPSAMRSSTARASSSSGSGLPSVASARASSFAEALLVQRVEDQHARARQKRGVELEGRVLGRRADQDDRAVLHDRQEAVLLGAVEAMDLVDEEQRLAAVGAPQPRRLEHLLEVGDAGKDRRNLLEGEARSRRRAAAPPSSCRCRAAPRRSSSRASRSGSCASARRPSPVRCSWPTTSASVRRAQPVGQRPARLRRASARPALRTGRPSVAQRLPQQLAVALDGEAPPARLLLGDLPAAARPMSIASPLTSRTMSRGWKPKPAAGEPRVDVDHGDAA